MKSELVIYRFLEVIGQTELFNIWNPLKKTLIPQHLSYTSGNTINRRQRRDI